MTDETQGQQAVTVAQIDWRDPIGILPLGGGPLVPAIVVAGPDKDGDYRVSFRDRSPNSWVSGLQWFHADGTPCGATGHRVVQARHRLASVSSASAEGFALVPREPTTAMVEACEQNLYDSNPAWNDPREIWSAMLAASPEPVPATNQAGEVLTQARELAIKYALPGGYDGISSYATRRGDADNAPYMRALVAALATQPATSHKGENKGNHDCLAKRRPGEPMFILLGRDPDAWQIVQAWAQRRLNAGGDPEHVALGMKTANAMREYAADPANRPASAPPADAYPILATQTATSQEGEDIAQIVEWIDEVIERAKRHGATEGIWLFGSQLRSVRAVLATTPTPPTLSEDYHGVRHLLLNLLAIIHRDGGHYVDAHGEFKATEDALQIVASLFAANPAVAFVQKVADLTGDELDAHASSELRDLAKETLAAIPAYTKVQQ